MSITRILGSFAMFVALSACKQKPSGEPAAAPPESQAPAEAAVPTSTSASSKKVLDEGLLAYEQIRAQLASDQTSQIAARAETLARSAQGAAAELPAALKEKANALATAAKALAGVEPSTLEKLRPAFGEVSKQVVALLAAEPSLRGSRRVMHCPMVESGYQKWVQIDTKVSNPYYGSQMLECGGESTWD